MHKKHIFNNLLLLINEILMSKAWVMSLTIKSGSNVVFRFRLHCLREMAESGSDCSSLFSDR